MEAELQDGDRHEWESVWGAWTLGQVVYTSGILGGPCMEFEGAPIPSFRVRWEWRRGKVPIFTQDTQAPAERGPWTSAYGWRAGRYRHT